MGDAELPKGWSETMLGNLVAIQNGYAFKSSSYTKSGFFVIRIGNVQDGRIELSKPAFVGAISESEKAFVLNADDILMSLTGNIGRVAVISEKELPAVLNQRVARFLSLVERSIDKKFLYQILRSPSFNVQIKARSKGAAQLNVSTKDISSAKLFLPPLPEQTRIANRLDELLAQVDTIKARVDAIPGIVKRFRQSVLAAAVSGRLTEEWRGQNATQMPNLQAIENNWREQYKSEGRTYKPPSIRGFSKPSEDTPDTWSNTQLGRVFDVFVGATPSRKKGNYWGGDVPWVSSSEVAFCRIKDTKEKITVDGLASSSTSLHPEGTVMLAMIGQGKTRGQPAILDIPACHNQNTAALRIPTKFCCSEYLYYFLCKQYEETRKVGGGNNQKALNKSTVQALPLALPSLREQQEIVRRVESLFAFADQIEQRVADAQSRIDQLTQSILAKAFRGELVPQDPNDEPASVLLERIRQEREAAAKLAKAAKRATRKPRKAKVAEA